MAQEQDIDQDLSELENRLERLRILYEQYFMGIEKREPGVQHKDVERRIQQLRKVRFPSTAMRFRFQTMVQRFNTLQQYWTRTCREIENGTYRRHLQKAARHLAATSPNERAAEDALADGKEREKARKTAADDMSALLDENVDLETELASALAAVEKAPAPPPKTLSSLDPSKEKPRLPASLGLTLGKAPALKSLAPDAKPSISPRLSTSPKPPGLQPIERPLPSGNPLSALGKQSPQIKEAPPTAVVNRTGKAPAPLTTLGPPSAARAPAPLPPAQRGTPGVRAPVAPAPALGNTGVPPRPAAAQKAAPMPTPQEKRPGAAAQGDTGLSGERIKALHASYIEARKQTNASPVSYEKLEQNIRETERKLREQHKGRQVDFEVGIKDGKAILKPRLK